MYCGNNRFEIGNRVLGSRYDCFRKGVGVGLALEGEAEYEPIEPNPAIYCGRARNAPANYDYVGTRYQCLQKGVGVGKSLRR